MENKLKHPFSCMVAGPSKAGKTVFVTTLIKKCKEMIATPPEKIWWCYGVDQTGYNDLKSIVTFHEGLVPIEKLKEFSPRPQLIILDDLMTNLANDTNLTELFTRGCHHLGISIVHIVQNIFFKGLRTSRVNCDYIVVLKNPSDKLQIQTLARQLYPNNTKFFLDVYNDATRVPYSHLLIDLTQTAEDDIRLRADIFSEHTVVYTPKL